MGGCISSNSMDKWMTPNFSLFTKSNKVHVTIDSGMSSNIAHMAKINIKDFFRIVFSIDQSDFTYQKITQSLMQDHVIALSLDLNDCTRCSFQDFFLNNTPNIVSHSTSPGKMEVMALGLHLCSGTLKEKIEILYQIIAING